LEKRSSGGDINCLVFRRFALLQGMGPGGKKGGRWHLLYLPSNGKRKVRERTHAAKFSWRVVLLGVFSPTERNAPSEETKTKEIGDSNEKWEISERIPCPVLPSKNNPVQGRTGTFGGVPP